jgi:hypothetical protein
MAQVMHACENQLHYYQVERPQRMDKVVKWKAIILGRDETRGSSGKKALNRQIFMVGYL